jgi:hypothetical protein
MRILIRIKVTGTHTKRAQYTLHKIGQITRNTHINVQSKMELKMNKIIARQNMVHRTEFDRDHPAISKYFVELIVSVLYSQETFLEIVEPIQQPRMLFPQDSLYLYPPIEASVRSCNMELFN